MSYTESDIAAAGYSYQELIDAGITPTFADDSVFIQRRSRMIFNMPLTRAVVENPYANTNYTAEQLNMRRKVEILKYNTGSNQSKLSKREKWAQLARGNYNTNKMSIPADETVSMSSAYAGIPGPPIQLQLDNTVPLYNFKTISTNSGMNNVPTEPLPEWSINYEKDVIYYPSIENTKLSTLFIRPTIKSPYYTFQYTVPVMATIQGMYMPIDTSGCTITATISALAFKVYYNESQINNNVAMTSALTNDTIELDLTPSVDTTDPTIETFDFQTSVRLGDLTINNIFLYTEPNYVYTFRLSYYVQYTITNLSSNTSRTEIQKRLQVKLKLNPSDSSSLPEPTNCILKTTNTDSIYGNTFTQQA